MHLTRVPKCKHEYKKIRDDYYRGQSIKECVKCGDRIGGYYGEDPSSTNEKWRRVLNHSEYGGKGAEGSRRKFIDHLHKSKNYGVNSLIIHDNVGKWQWVSTNLPCLARLGHVQYDIKKPRDLVMLTDWCYGTPSKDLSTKVKKLWLEYLANDSPYADCFISKDPEDMLNFGCQYDLNYPARMIIQAASGVRYIAEYPNRVQTFYELVINNKIDPNKAMIVQQYALVRKNSKKIHVSVHGMGHSMWNTHNLKKYRLSGLYNRIQNRFKIKPMNESWDWYPTMEMWKAGEAKGNVSLPEVEKVATNKRDVWGEPIYEQQGMSIPNFVSEFYERNLKL